MFKKILVFALICTLFSSCTSDDDICLNGDATARMKVKFKSKDGKIKTLDSLYVKVDYGKGLENVIARKQSTDSILVPLRVDDSSFTEMYFSTSKNGLGSKVKVNYSTRAEYVSPACGIKKVYENVNPVLEVPAEVTALEVNQNIISNESKTHLFLIF